MSPRIWSYFDANSVGGTDSNGECGLPKADVVIVELSRGGGGRGVSPNLCLASSPWFSSVLRGGGLDVSLPDVLPVDGVVGEADFVLLPDFGDVLSSDGFVSGEKVTFFVLSPAAVLEMEGTNGKAKTFSPVPYRLDDGLRGVVPEIDLPVRLDLPLVDELEVRSEGTESASLVKVDLGVALSESLLSCSLSDVLWGVVPDPNDLVVVPEVDVGCVGSKRLPGSSHGYVGGLNSHLSGTGDGDRLLLDERTASGDVPDLWRSLRELNGAVDAGVVGLGELLRVTSLRRLLRSSFVIKCSLVETSSDLLRPLSIQEILAVETCLSLVPDVKLGAELGEFRPLL